MRRSLSHYWRINLAVILGAAVATAVLTGALLVGDSVKGSLRDLTLERLGEIDHLLVRQNYFRENLAEELTKESAFAESFDKIAPAIITTGNSVQAKTKTRASQINIIAVDDRFLAFFDTTGDLTAALRKQPGQIFPSIVINQALQRELQAAPGDQILLSLERPATIARGGLLGKKDTEDVVETARFVLTRIIPDRGVGRFGVRPHQTLPMNAFVPLEILQKALGRPTQVNALLVSQKDSYEIDHSSDLSNALQHSLRVTDLGLKFVLRDKSFVLEEDGSIFSPREVALLTKVGKSVNLTALPSYTYLSNRMEANGNLLPYSTVAAIDSDISSSFESLTLLNGGRAPALKEDEILLNKWAADDLAIKTGQPLKMTYYAVGNRDELYERAHEFKVAGIVRMSGLAIDRNLTPDFPGISDADNMAEWDPPFKVDLGLIRPRDEDYWDKYRGTPKAFVSLGTGQKLWGSRFGNVTSIHFAGEQMETQQAVETFKQELLRQAEPQDFGYAFQPVKAQGLASSSGATDFSGLFVGFSLFLIVSAGLLVGLLFRLGVEQRAKEIGMLLSLGYRSRKVGRQFLAEGIVLAAVGAFLGLGGAVAYAWLMMVGLRTWWVAAVGSPFLFLHVTPLSLAMGYFISIIVILLSIWLGFRKLSKLPPSALLTGVTQDVKEKRVGRLLHGSAWLFLVLSFGIAGVAFASGDAAHSPAAFFTVGTFLLISGLCFLLMWLRGRHSGLNTSAGIFATFRLAARNAPRNPGRSMLSAALVACACFVIVAVGANRHDFGEELLQRDSGAGGYSFLAQADIPLQRDLSTEQGRLALGFSDEAAAALNSAQIVPFRLLPGDDASCLNLYQVVKPRLLGVTNVQIERGGFGFSGLLADDEKPENPWQLLTRELEPGIIPAFGDANSVQWILHSGLGKDIEMTDEFGVQIKLRFVGMLKKCIFQSEVLISEENFLKHFPSQNGYAYYLIDSPPGQADSHRQLLEETLSSYGFDISSTADRLSAFNAVENTYLSTFQTLGGFGLLLGTLGLGMILIRNVIERRAELATLRAFGFRSVTLAWMVLAENAFLLTVGIAIGALAAVIAVTPSMLSSASQIPWAALFGSLVLVFAVGMLSSTVAVTQALKIPLLPALRAE